MIVGLLLSSSSPTGGLSSLNGQDLEIFKKTKDQAESRASSFYVLVNNHNHLIIIFYRVG